MRRARRQSAARTAQRMVRASGRRVADAAAAAGGAGAGAAARIRPVRAFRASANSRTPVSPRWTMANPLRRRTRTASQQSPMPARVTRQANRMAAARGVTAGAATATAIATATNPGVRHATVPSLMVMRRPHRLRLRRLRQRLSPKRRLRPNPPGAGSRPRRPSRRNPRSARPAGGASAAKGRDRHRASNLPHSGLKERGRG